VLAVLVLAAAAALLPVPAPPPAAGGSISGVLPVADLARRADLVVIGRVQEVTAVRRSADGLVETLVTLHVEEVLKGAAGPTVEFARLGGRVGAVTSVVPGAPEFAAGERVLVFLARRPDGRLGLSDLFQAKFSLERDPRASVPLAVRRLPDSGQVLSATGLDQVRADVARAAHP
jgi:hypothetical protein